MRKITINNIEIECDDNVELAIEGNKITIKAAPSEKVEHHHHYWPTSVPLTQPSQPYYGTPQWGTPHWGTVIVSGGNSDNPPMTSGFVAVPPGNPNLLLNGGAQSFTANVQ